MGMLSLAILWLAAWFAAHAADGSPPGPPEYRITVAQALEGWSLTRDWRFRRGDDPAWADPVLDDSGWQRVDLPHRWLPERDLPLSEAYAWYRLHVRFEMARGRQREQLANLGLQLGAVLSAYELYAGGILLGGVGSLPPAPEAVIDYDRERIFAIPLSAIGPDGSLVLALRIWGGSEAAMARWGIGPYTGEVRLGTYDRLQTSLLIGPIPWLLVTIVCMAFGLYHLYLYSRNRQLEGFLWFGLSALVIGLYCLMLNDWRYQLGWSAVTYKKIEYAALYLVPPLVLQMFCALLQHPVGRWLRRYQLSFILLGLWWVLIPGLDIHITTQSLWQWWTLPALALVGWLVLRNTWRGQREARTVFLGALVFIATCLHDIFGEQVRVTDLRLLPWGFLALMLAMAVSLGNRFTAMLNHLEEVVAARTAELSEANRQLSESARIDPLTGLLNRRGFAEEAEAEIHRVQRNDQPFSLALCDVDLFKSVNDRYGHACGDYVLVQVAGLLREHVRDVDRVARWGGEEFILLLPQTDSEGAAVLAEKLREVIARAVFEFEGERLQVTMTFGVAAFRPGENIERCIARADDAMYQGKDAGRNQVMVGKYRGLKLVT